MQATEKLFLIIVEDDTTIANNLVALTKKLGYEVEHFDKGEDAVEFCQHEKLPNILLMDIELNKDNGKYCSGIEVAQDIQAFCHKMNKNLGLIYLTSNSNNKIYLEAAYKNTVVEDYLPKPYPEILLAKKLELLSSKLAQLTTQIAQPKEEQHKNVKLVLLENKKQLVCTVSNSLIKKKLILFDELVAVETLKVKKEGEDKTKTKEKIVIYTVEQEKSQSYEVACTLTEFAEIIKEEREFFCGSRFILNQRQSGLSGLRRLCLFKVPLKRLHPDGTQDNTFHLSKSDKNKY